LAVMLLGGEKKGGVGVGLAGGEVGQVGGRFVGKRGAMRWSTVLEW